MIYGYTRVSTETQILENQSFEIKEYCKNHCMKVDVWYEEKVSGTKKAAERELGKLLRIAEPGDVIITTEISRIGRNFADCINTIQDLVKREITLIAIKQGFVLDNSLNAKVVSTVLALASDIERSFLSERVKQALAYRKSQGIKLGRPYGSKNVHHKLEPHKEFIEMAIRTGKTRYWLIKKLKTHAHTLREYLNKTGLMKEYNRIQELKKNGKFYYDEKLDEIVSV